MQKRCNEDKVWFWYQEMIFNIKFLLIKIQTLIEELNEKYRKLYDIENTTASLFSRKHYFI